MEKSSAEISQILSWHYPGQKEK